MIKFYTNSGLLIFFLLFLIHASLLFAHQPRLVMDRNATRENPIIVDAPEISKAYYAELKGSSDYYKIVSEKPFKLYLGLLLPDIAGEDRYLVSAEVTDSSNKKIVVLEAKNYQWNPFFEPFGGDRYLQGPEARINLPAGTYFIKVYNKANYGKYSLAIGEIESFPPVEIVKAYILLPIIKEKFFNKPIIIPFLLYIGIALSLGSTVILSILRISYRKSVGLETKINEFRRYIKPSLGLGILIIIITWILIYLKNPVNFYGALNTLILIILTILFLYSSRKFAKAAGGKKLPFKSLLLSLIGFLLFLFIAVVVI